MAASFQSDAFQASGFQIESLIAFQPSAFQNNAFQAGVFVPPEPPKPKPRPSGGGRPWWFPELEGQWTDDSYNQFTLERRRRINNEAVFIFKP